MSADKELFYQGLNLFLVLGAGLICLLQGYGHHHKPKLPVLTLKLSNYGQDAQFMAQTLFDS